MTKVYEGSVSIVKNTKGEIALKRDPNGIFNAEHAVELHAKVQELAKRHKLPISKYALFIPEGGTELVLLVNRYGNPYLAKLPPAVAGGGSKRAVVKLA